MDYDSELIAVYNDEALPMECQIISRFKNEETEKSYLVYTDGSRNEEGKKNMFVVSYDPDVAEENQLKPVETYEEWESISGFLEELRKVIDEKGLDL